MHRHFIPALFWALFFMGCLPSSTDKGTSGRHSSGADTSIDTSDSADTSIACGFYAFDDFHFVIVCAHTFEMGCTQGQSGCESDETVHNVTLTQKYTVGETEVTQGQFEAMMGYNPSYFSSCGATCPVDHVSWDESAAYTNNFSSWEGVEECYTCTGSGSEVECAVKVNPYDCHGYRLLTEAEWEGAARCGDDLLYAGSDDILDVGWISNTSNNTPHAVASLNCNPCNIYDMSGNVLEWTQDWYGSLSSDDSTNPIGALSGRGHVARGGSWATEASWARVAFRQGEPDDDGLTVGFRIASSY